jgi:hypothetical protein
MNNELTIFTEKEGRNAFTLANLMFNPQSMATLNEYAVMLSSGGLVPEHFHGKPGDLMAVIIQAERWGVDHIAVAQSSFVISGKLGYEAKLLQSIAKSLGGIEFSGKYYGNWSGIVGNTKKENVQRTNKNTQAKFTVSADVQGWSSSDEIGVGLLLTATYPCGKTKEIDIKLNSCYPRNSTNWIFDPEQQIHYTGIKRFLNRHEPHLKAGIRDYDDITAREHQERQLNDTPKKPLSKSHEIVDVDDILNGDSVDNIIDQEIEIDDIDALMNESVNTETGEFKISKYEEITDFTMQVEDKQGYSACRQMFKSAKDNGELSQKEIDDLNKLQAELYQAFLNSSN